ncbi:MAG: lipoate--protein ligase family protein [Gemmatales bacterium]|nr:lipoate--protein ligase family protein [Gemmatales bacterium]MDW7995245.1 lipoate--protein ligase family protein [Gemmatales bacterium]
MRFLDLTLPTLEQNLALDEALLLQAEFRQAGAVLRCWEVPQPCIVLGMNGIIAREVRFDLCQRDGVPVARRCSGGGTVVLAPGCLVFSLILPTEASGCLDVRSSLKSILNRVCSGLLAYGVPTQLAGTSDLVYHDRKVSGNAQRRLRTYFLHHGTLLYDFDVELAERYLPLPSRMPEYRRQRRHRDFLTNLPLRRDQLLACLRQAFEAEITESDWPGALVHQLVRDKYARWDWLTRR